jgi:K+/H+ antiporter YhaU regulatory subunit KhtT
MTHGDLTVAEQRKLDPAREQNRRRIYVSQRLPLIKQELAQLKSERAKIQEDSKIADDKKKAELRKRQSYIVTRMGILREEQKDMTNERKAIKESRAKRSTDDEG